jgi:molybdopterin converting factor subunit 1
VPNSCQLWENEPQVFAMNNQQKTIQIQYFALLREERGLTEETIQTGLTTARQLFDELKTKHQFSLGRERLNLAVNEEFQPWDTVLKDGDAIVFIPPVAGG